MLDPVAMVGVFQIVVVVSADDYDSTASVFRMLSVT